MEKPYSQRPCLLQHDGKSSAQSLFLRRTPLLLSAFFSPLMRITQEPIYIGLCCEQLLHFLTRGGVFGVVFFLFGKQRFILGLERLYGSVLKRAVAAVAFSSNSAYSSRLFSVRKFMVCAICLRLKPSLFVVF